MEMLEQSGNRAISGKNLIASKRTWI